MLIVTVFFQLSDGIQVVALGALRGFTDVKIPTVITFVAYWLVALPTAYLLSQLLGFGALGIWYALAGGLTISAILLVIRFNGELRRFATQS
jgi:MATE family multidrug resistance protein